MDELERIDAAISACHDEYLKAVWSGRIDEAKRLGKEVDAHLVDRWAVMQRLDDAGQAAAKAKAAR